MQHVIIGAGPAGVVAAETLRTQDPGCDITIIGNEDTPPYSRMALPYLLANNISEQGTYLRTADYYQQLNIQVLEDGVTRIDSKNNRLTLESNATLSYDKLLVATGSTPVSAPIDGIDLPDVHACWTMNDARNIALQAKKNSRVVLMGAGFIGCIIMESLVNRGAIISVIEMGNRMVPRMLDEKAGGLLQLWCTVQGVDVLTSTKVTAIRQQSEALSVELDNGKSIEADLVISATGVTPNLQLAINSGIKTDAGILVDDFMQTSISNIYAAGDVAQGKDLSTGQYTVQAIQPTATDHGRIAALNMLGHATRHNGSLNMNSLDTLGLVSHSFGLWMGVENGASVSLCRAANYRYINLQFGTGDKSDVLVGASTLGFTQHIGVLRGLIQGETHLGSWKGKLLKDPTRYMEAYVASIQELSNVV